MASPIKGLPISTVWKKPGKAWSTGFHTGVDYAAPKGTEIFAVQDGTVLPGGWGSAYGNQILVDQKALNDGTPNRIAGGWAIYAHCSEIFVKPGDKITKGQLIGKVGNSGNVRASNGGDGSHLHYEVRDKQRWTGGKDLDPMPFINA